MLGFTQWKTGEENYAKFTFIMNGRMALHTNAVRDSRLPAIGDGDLAWSSNLAGQIMGFPFYHIADRRFSADGCCCR